MDVQQVIASNRGCQKFNYRTRKANQILHSLKQGQVNHSNDNETGLS